MPEKIYINVLFTKRTVSMIDSLVSEGHFPSRSEAIRTLTVLGLTTYLSAVNPSNPLPLPLPLKGKTKIKPVVIPEALDYIIKTLGDRALFTNPSEALRALALIGYTHLHPLLQKQVKSTGR